jgi:REP element-mobilizing transposase RayT
MPDHPLAYLLSFRTYGTWLHGDSRGSTDRHHRVYGCSRLPADARLQARRRASLIDEPVELAPEQRRIVEATLTEVCAHRCWTLYAANVRSNHVHAVVEAKGVPERMLVDFKAWSTRRLVEMGALARERRVWSRHGSTCYLWRAEAVESACFYVAHMQDEQQEGIDPMAERWHAWGHEQVVPPV